MRMQGRRPAPQQPASNFHFGRSKLRIMEHFYSLAAPHFAFRISPCRHVACALPLLCDLSLRLRGKNESQTQKGHAKQQQQQQKSAARNEYLFQFVTLLFSIFKIPDEDKGYLKMIRRMNEARQSPCSELRQWTAMRWTGQRRHCVRQINFRSVRWSQYFRTIYCQRLCGALPCRVSLLVFAIE